MHAAIAPDTTSQRWGFRIQGAVQGVGFRPWCVRQSQELGLHGWVRNDGQGLALSLQGPLAALQALAWRLRHRPPALARIRSLTHWPEPLQTLPGDAQPGCRILPSPGDASPEATPATGLPPDTAPCADCLDELFDPTHRRWRHPFINCTQCGPRWSVTARLPYDRPHTSLAGFALCPDCAAEYHDPADRRHHAQPTACPACGPQLALWTPQGQPLDGEGEPLAAAVARLRAGQVLAVKGVGGYHLMCDALQAAPLARLRAAKQRASKPFALLAPNRASADRWVDLSLGHGALVADAVAAQLQSPRRPILLLPCRPGVAPAHSGVAPGLAEWGVMLPPSPLHELLCHTWLGQPAGDGWRHAAHPGLLWVMTSANPGGEPLVIDEAEALQHLGGLADALLVHNRPILGRLDDSVARPMPPLCSTPPSPDVSGPTQAGPDAAARAGAVHTPFVRRARGWVPEPIALPAWAADAPPVLATGGWLKNTVCLTRRGEAFLSGHVGDLASAASRAALVQAQQRLGQFLGVQPQAVAHDLHPDFFSTQHAQALAAAWGVPAVPVQHHHAHAAAVLAEHGHPGPALALVLDGTGLGTDGSVWGGELLRLDAGGARCTRLAHLPALHLPGGDRAASEPWRLAAGLLAAAGRAGEVAARFPGLPGASTLAALLARGRAGNGTSSLAGPRCTSAGRWFDAAAALLLGHGHNRHEAEGALRLESLASQAGGLAVPPWAGAWHLDDQGRLHWPGLLQRLLDAPTPPAGDEGGSAATEVHAGLAAAFHHTLVQAWVAWVAWHARAQGLGVVALGGGCFINRWLRQGLVAGLQAARLQVLEAVQAPPGDGGLSLGQALVALATVAPTEPAAADPASTALAGPGLRRPAPPFPLTRS